MSWDSSDDARERYEALRPMTEEEVEAEERYYNRFQQIESLQDDGADYDLPPKYPEK